MEKPLLLSQQLCDLQTIVHRTRPALAWLTASVLVLTLILMPQPGSAQENAYQGKMPSQICHRAP